MIDIDVFRHFSSRGLADFHARQSIWLSLSDEVYCSRAECYRLISQHYFAGSLFNDADYFHDAGHAYHAAALSR